MIIPTHFGPAGPLWRTRAPLHVSLSAWAFSRLTFFDLTVADLRIALAAMLTRSLIQAADAVVRHVMGRAWRGARFAEDITAAATMVAAARH
ncbi:hypothetical protein JQ612_14720 [Bradyrhizobium manausense]|uniref:hypothetical protein n=1 Tax=Bradyrhizobium manausense TaxID=989370 RepID=UPI001BAB0F75|nr:hypothetical protein [Bradyrhizobium manausense]MBR0684948.1 hypothetical protein [Bradyrhizobium manausense]MBR0723397.1 hypothetical protein [Bradyrhizobium manausense]MBR0834443.1 hypothetical protein [Bradyrhizobium manausense]